MSSSASTSSAHVLRSRMAEIDAETAALHARLAILAAERKPIFDALRSVTYPGVVDLPPEVTAEIFLGYFTRGDIGYSSPTQLGWTPSYGPLLLANVCRRWRDTAVALQPIWSKFHIMTSDTASESQAALLECWLPRAGNHPLTISVYGGVTSIFTSLAPVLSQLRSLECYIDSDVPFPNDVLLGRLPSLESVRLFSNIPERGLLAAPLTAFADCPQLREVRLSQIPTQSLVLHWAQITALELSSMETDEALTVLQQTVALERLVTGLDVLDEDWAGVPLRLAQLHTLKVDGGSELLDRLTLPSLTDIELSLPSRDYTLPEHMSPRARFVSLIQRFA
ncbi:hypothetical protein FB45DRAFT_366861 [Roridomyces roridus]|uniref:F-box domain-containing protein n=1 Tax=Roridomyces roridus TaxID=1738132 RepID=A0AAD7FX23_9AGAR|nr:hypothetical protein FB45DRAFT_366861 [Roridomyces roridus]